MSSNAYHFLFSNTLNFTRHHRRFVIGIAILAMLLNALMPNLSQAFALNLASKKSSAWIELCTSTGTSWVRLNGSGVVVEKRTVKPLSAPASVHTAHCDYCLPHAGNYLLPGTSIDWSVNVPRLQFDFGSNTRFFTPTLSWFIPAVRAPPQ